MKNRVEFVRLAEASEETSGSVPQSWPLLDLIFPQSRTSLRRTYSPVQNRPQSTIGSSGMAPQTVITARYGPSEAISPSYKDCRRQ